MPMPVAHTSLWKLPALASLWIHCSGCRMPRVVVLEQAWIENTPSQHCCGSQLINSYFIHHQQWEASGWVGSLHHVACVFSFSKIINKQLISVDIVRQPKTFYQSWLMIDPVAIHCHSESYIGLAPSSNWDSFYHFAEPIPVSWIVVCRAWVVIVGWPTGRRNILAVSSWQRGLFFPDLQGASRTGAR